MKTGLLSAIENFLIIQLNQWSFFPVAFSLTLFLGSYAGCSSLSLIEWGLCGIIMYGFYLIRRYITNLAISFILHLAVLGLVIFVFSGDVAHDVIISVSTMVFMIVSVYRHYQKIVEDKAISIYFSLGIALAVVLVMNYYEIREYNSLFCYILIIMSGIYFIQLYLERFLSFVRMNADSTGYMPFKDMLKSGMLIVLGMSVFAVAVLFVIPNAEEMDEIVKGILKLPGIILAIIFGFFGSRADNNPETKIESELMTRQDYLPDSPTENPAAEIISAIFLLIIFAVLLFYIIGLVRKLIRWIIAQFKKSGTQDEGTVETREKIKVERSIVFGKKGPRGRSNEAKVRRMFYKTIRSKSRQIIGERSVSSLNRYTSRECERALKAEGMAGIYEKARYSEEQVSDEDVAQMKIAVKTAK